MIPVEIWEAFKTAWDSCVGKPGYDRGDWLVLHKQLDDVHNPPEKPIPGDFAPGLPPIVSYVHTPPIAPPAVGGPEWWCQGCGIMHKPVVDQLGVDRQATFR